ncbi:hypothetical protein ILYODFUR_003718 [Ilyodon furcidens]|uniref:Uncharacterized protein n=1 Tax=Ilyodon furcidens TaxID=33524 RepID=A0ABV0V2N8_9TELE
MNLTNHLQFAKYDALTKTPLDECVIDASVQIEITDAFEPSALVIIEGTASSVLYQQMLNKDVMTVDELNLKKVHSARIAEFSQLLLLQSLYERLQSIFTFTAA